MDLSRLRVVSKTATQKKPPTKAFSSATAGSKAMRHDTCVTHILALEVRVKANGKARRARFFLNTTRTETFFIKLCWVAGDCVVRRVIGTHDDRCLVGGYLVAFGCPSWP